MRARSPRFLALVALAAAGCGATERPTVELRPPIVTVSRPAEIDVTDTYYFEGYTAAVETVDVRARVTGYLSKIYFTDGADVSKNAALLLIDPAPYEAAYKEAVAELNRVEVQLKRLDADLARAKVLLPKRTITQEEYDKTAADRAAAAAERMAREATVEQADLNRHFCAIKAPIAGRVSRALVTVGNLVTANTTLLTTIVSMDPVYAYFDVDEPTVLKIQKAIREGKLESARETKAPVYLGLDIDQGYPYQGTIDFVENRVDQGTGTLKVRAVFPNGNAALSPGLHARIEVPLGKPYKALAVTERAIGTNQARKFVYIVNDKNEVVEREVALGPLRDGMRVINAGVTSDERVIVNGLQRVRPGIVVDPKEEEKAQGRSQKAEAANPGSTPISLRPSSFILQPAA